MSTDVGTYVTPEEYLAAERMATETRSEWAYGETREMVGAKHAHIVIVWNLVTLFGNAFKSRPLVAYPNDMKVRVPDGPYYYPDICVTPDPPDFEDDRRDIVTNPLVVIEVLSPSTEAIDRGEKLDEYRRIPSLTDYLLVAQDRRHVDHWVKRGDGSWRLSIATGNEDDLPLPAIGCEISVGAIYDRIVE